MKVGCVIQGDIRRGSDIVIPEMLKHFDYVVVSTWSDDKGKLPDGDYDVVINNKPANFGISNRNLQRWSVYQGLVAAEKAGCDYVLKWRTDMLPTAFNLDLFLKGANYKVPDKCKSRIVTGAFRHLSVKPDWFSSIPDLFSFGHIEMMKMLWGIEGIDFSKEVNFPHGMIDECGKEWMERENYGAVFCAESELYAYFKYRLEQKTGKKLSHPEIALEYMYLFDHDRLKICWFHAKAGYRPLLSLCFPWWTEKNWRKNKFYYIDFGYPVKLWWKLIGSFICIIATKKSLIQQRFWFKKHF